jgi:hypothetical protein
VAARSCGGGEGVRESAQNTSLSSNGWVICGLTAPQCYPQPLGGLEPKQTDNRGERLASVSTAVIATVSALALRLLISNANTSF